MKTNILIFPSPTAIGQEAIRSLQNNKHFNLILEPAGRINTTVFDPNNAKQVFDLAKELNALIVPCHDELIYQLQKQDLAGRVVFGHSNVSPDFWRDKKSTYSILRNKIKCPKVDDINYPYFVKPRRGQGSRGCFLAYCKDDIPPKVAIDKDYIFLEYLPGDEFTVDCFNSSSGELLYGSARQRLEINNGIATKTSTYAESVNLTDHLVWSDLSKTKWTGFIEQAKIINSIFKFKGPWFFQMKEDSNGIPTLLEVAGRIAGSSGISRINGVNLTELAVWQHLGHSVEIRPQEIITEYSRGLGFTNTDFNLTASTIYVDWDDTLCYGAGSLNTRLVGKLMELKLNGHSIVLLTKNPNPFKDLPQIFNDVIIVPKGRSKSEYVSNDCGFVFIDDSFKERLEMLTDHPAAASFGVQEALEIL